MQADIKHVILLHCRSVYRVDDDDDDDDDDGDDVGGTLPLVVWEIRRYNVTEKCAATNICPEDGDITLLRNVGTSLLKKSHVVRNLNTFL